MAITMEQRFLSPNRMSQATNYRKDKYALSYWLHGDAGEDEDAIYAYLTANTPLTKDALIRDRIDVERLESPDRWDARVFYTHPQSSSTTKTPEPGEPPRITVRSAGGRTEQLLYSLEFIEEDVDGVFADKWSLALLDDKIKKLIGWKLNPDGVQELEGYDLQAGGVEIAVQIAVTSAQVTGGYLVNTAAHAANQAVNLNPWQGFAAKTLRFISFQATPRNDTNPAWDITYTFDFSPTTTVTIGDLSLVKQGQHIIDVIAESQTVEDGPVVNAQFNLPKAVRLATHRIYPEIDYATELLI